MKTFSAWLAICPGNSPVTGEIRAQRPVTRSFDVFFDLRLNKRLSKQSWGWWFESPSRSLWRHCNVCLHTRLSYIKLQTILWMIIAKIYKGCSSKIYMVRFLFLQIYTIHPYSLGLPMWASCDCLIASVSETIMRNKGKNKQLQNTATD